MNIRFIKQNDKDFRQTLGIIHKYLPKIQTLPDFVMRLLLLNPSSHLLGFYEKDRQVGAAFLSENSGMIYMMYLVVLPEYRRQRYGSGFFSWMEGYAKGRSIVWNVEKSNPSAPFYQSVSGIDTGYVRTILGHEYNVCCRNGFDPTEYKRLARSIYFGFNSVRIEKKV